MRLSVIGVPATQGSKRAFPYRGKDGKQHVAITESGGAKHRSWRGAIVEEATLRCLGNATKAFGNDKPLGGPVVVTFTFYLPRPKSAPKSRLFPDKKPDSLKCARLVEDALSHIAYVDDAQIVTHIIHKRFAVGRPPGVEIELRPATEEDL